MTFRNYMIIEEVNMLHMNDLIEATHPNTFREMNWFLTRVLNKLGR